MHLVREPKPGRGGAGGAPMVRPSIGLFLSEPARALAQYAGLPTVAPFLSFAPRGDGHGVLVLPGLLASDTSTVPLRRFLRWLGYDVRGWNLGRNLGPTDEVLDELPRALVAVAERTGGPVSLIGWSLGGIYARELARQSPGQARQVITLGSPFALTDPRQSRAESAYQRRGHLHAVGSRVPTRDQVARPIGVPSTAAYSRRDGIVSWQACIEPETALHENVEDRRLAGRRQVRRVAGWTGACRAPDRSPVPPGRRRRGRDTRGGFDRWLDAGYLRGRQRRGMPAAQPVGVGDHGQGRQGHGGGGDDRGQPDAGDGVKDAGGDWDADAVVGEREEQVLADVAHRGPRQGDRGHHPGERAGDEGDVGGLDGHVGAGADRQADVGRGERGRVVDAVAHHADFTALGL